MGGDDPGIPLDDVEAFDAALDDAGVEHEVVVYPGAPHSFFDRKYEEFAADSEDAWQRVLAFVDRLARGVGWARESFGHVRDPRRPGLVRRRHLRRLADLELGPVLGRT